MKVSVSICEQDAYESGADDFEDGVPASDNPFLDDQLRDAWFDGWTSAEAEARDHAALEAEAERIRAVNDRHPPLRRDLIWQSPLLIGAAVVALIVGITLIGRAMV